MAILEGKELDGKIGDVGTYSVDVQANGHVDALVGIDFVKELSPGIDAQVKVDAGFKLKLATIAAHAASKSSSPVLKFIADALGKLDAGEPVAPALVAMADEHAAAEAQKA